MTKKSKHSYIFKLIVVAGVLLVAAFAVAYCLYVRRYKQETTFTKEHFTVRGVDLSHHNPIIDWEKTNENGHIRFVYLKATGGVSHKDRNYIYNYRSAKASGLKTGSYHFYLFATSGKQQAKHFISTAQCVSGDLLPAIDVEHSNDNPHSKDTAYINLVVKELKVLENELYEHYGVHPVIYTNKQCYALYVKNRFENNPLWICDLGSEPSGIPNWVIWQFSHKGNLPCIDEDIDLNYFRYSYDRLDEIIIP
jgi:lysozyme